MNKKGLVAALTVLLIVAVGLAAYFVPTQIAKKQIDYAVAELAKDGLDVSYKAFSYNIATRDLTISDVVIKTHGGLHKVKEISIFGGNENAVKRVNDASYYNDERMKVRSYHKVADLIEIKGYESEKRQIAKVVLKAPALRQLEVIPTKELMKTFSEYQVFGHLMDALKVPEIRLEGVKGKAFGDDVESIVVINITGEGIDAINVTKGSIYNNYGAKTAYDSLAVSGLKYSSFVKASKENRTKATVFDELGGAQAKNIELVGPDNSITNIASIDLKKVIMKNGMPMNVDVKVSKIEPDIKTMNDRAKAMLSLLGYEKMALDFAMKFNTKEKDDGFSFTMDEVSVGAADFGKLFFGFNMTGRVNASGFRQGAPDMNTIRLTAVKLNFKDDSIVNRFIGMQAQNSGMTEEQFRETIKTSLEQMFEQKRHFSAYRMAVMDFVDNPEELEILANPTKPVLLNRLMGPVMQQDAAKLIELLNITVSSNKI